MKHFRLLTLLIVLLMLSWSSGAQAQATDIALTVNDGTSIGTKILHFGIDPTATDGIDAALGEAELPPVPPAGIFEARFIGADIGINLGQGLAKDYRQGTATVKVTHIHELFYQLGTGTTITILWNLPSGATGVLEDLFGGVLVKKTMSGKDSLKVTNPSVLSKLKMTITYTPAAQPSPPSHLTATATSATEVKLQWQDNSDNETGFRLERKIGTGSFATLDSIAANVTTYSDLSVAEGTSYTYRVFAFSATGESPASNEAPVTTRLIGPSECSATAKCLNEIVITWRDNSTKELGYKILRSITGTEGTFTEIGTTPANKTIYTDSGLKSGTTYYYRLFAYNEAAQSSYCTVSATTAIVTWSSVMKLRDACDGVQDLLFGQAANATAGIDVELCEYELPPPPPFGIFDARFELPVTPIAHSTTDLRSDKETHADWVLQFQTGPCGHPLELEWDNTSLPEGRFVLQDAVTGTLVNVDMKLQNRFTLRHTGIDRLKLQYTMAISETVSVQKGWNIVSVPVLAPDMAADRLFPSATSFAYSYKGKYATAMTLENGCGYWLKFDSTQTVTIKGVAVRATTIPVTAGWNLIGPYDQEVPVATITSTPGGIIKSDFFTFNGKYHRVDTIASGKGYWVKAKEAGELNLLPSAMRKTAGLPSLTAMSSTQVPAVDIPLTVTDGAGGTQQLRFGLDTTATPGIDAALGEAELPPVPPTGVFDARFIGTDISIPLGQGSYKDYRTGSAKFIGTQTHELSYQVGSGTTVTISWDLPTGVTGVLQDLFGGILVNQPMSGKGSYVVATPGILNKLKMIITYTGTPLLLPPPPPLLMSPSDGEAGLPTNLTLEWYAASDATSYQVQVSTSPVFSTTVVDQSGIPQTTYPISGLLNNTTYYWRVNAANAGGKSDWSSMWSFTTLVTSVEEKGEATPAAYSLSPNYPNPLRSSGTGQATKISYELPEAAEIKLEIFNILGEHIRTLIHQHQPAGRYSLLWNGADELGRAMPSGIYLYRLEARGKNGQKFVATQKMNLVR